jgi:adenylate kinase
MDIVLLGPPGAGKGTQANRLETVTKTPHISSGDIFRAIRRESTPLAKEVRSYMDRGEYVPDDLTIELVLKRINEQDAKKGFLLDGFPRTLPQAGALDGALAEEGRKVDVALLVTAPRDVLLDRIQGRLVCPQCHAIYNAATKPPKDDMLCDVCGHPVEKRTDETADAVRVRLDTYMHQTQPLIDYYRNKGVLVEIDGSRPEDQVELAVDSALGLRGVR